MKCGDKVKYNGVDGDNMSKEWLGTVIGMGKLGVTVEFEEDFVGHEGLAYDGYNDEKTSSATQSAWWFDYQPDPNYAYTFLVSSLRVVKGPK